MRRLQIIQTSFILITSSCCAQTNYDSTFLHELKKIDSYIFSIDSFKQVVNSKLIGNFNFGEFEGSCLHHRSIYLIYKIHLDFDTTTSKTIYFKDNKPVKIIDDKAEFYSLEKWVDSKGDVVEPLIIDKLLLLAEQCLKTVRIVLY